MFKKKRRRNSSSLSLRYYKQQTSQFLSQNLILVFLGLIFIAGIILGTHMLTGSNNELINTIKEITGNFITIRSRQDINTTLMTTFVSSVGLLVVVFLCGFSAVAIPFILFVPFLKGISFGLTAGGIISSLGGSGVLVTGLLLIPNTIISIVIVMYGAKNALALSKQLFMFLLKGEKTGEEISVQLYCFRFLFYAGVLAIGAGIESILFKLLLQFIS